MIHFNHRPHGTIIGLVAECGYHPPEDQVISREEDGRLMGGVIFQGYTGASLEMHFAGFHPNWINRDVLWVSFHYPFVQLGCKKVVARIPSSNQKALEIDAKLGFKEEARIPDIYPDGDLVIMTMYREDCRWLRLKPKSLTPGGADGQEEQGAPASGLYPDRPGVSATG